VFAVIKQVLLIFLNSTTVFLLPIKYSAGTSFEVTGQAGIFQAGFECYPARKKILSILWLFGGVG